MSKFGQLGPKERFDENAMECKKGRKVTKRMQAFRNPTNKVTNVQIVMKIISCLPSPLAPTYIPEVDA